MQVFCRTSYHLAIPAIAALARSEHIYKDRKFFEHVHVVRAFVGVHHFGVHQIKAADRVVATYHPDTLGLTPVCGEYC